MDTLLKEDLVWCVRRLPADVRKLLKDHPNDLFIAGGFIRSCISGDKVMDLDLFSKSKGTAKLYAKLLKSDKFKMITTDNAYTVFGKDRKSVQFIYKWSFDKPSDVIPSFDFTIAKSILWYDGEKWQSLCDERFYADLAAKRLTYCSPKRIEEVGGSMLRVLKFYQRGYRIPLEDLGAVMSRCVSGVNFDNPMSEGEENLSIILSGLLREVDPMIDPEHICHMPSVSDEE